MRVIRLTRRNFDFLTGFSWMTKDERAWARRILFLETVAV